MFFIVFGNFTRSNLGNLPVTCFGRLYLNESSIFVLGYFTLDVEHANYESIIPILSHRDRVAYSAVRNLWWGAPRTWRDGQTTGQTRTERDVWCVWRVTCNIAHALYRAFHTWFDGVSNLLLLLKGVPPAYILYPEEELFNRWIWRRNIIWWQLSWRFSLQRLVLPTLVPFHLLYLLGAEAALLVDLLAILWPQMPCSRRNGKSWWFRFRQARTANWWVYICPLLDSSLNSCPLEHR